MSMEFLVKVDNNVYEISGLVTSISYSDRLNDGCSKLEFSYVGDILKVKNGSVISFKYDNVGIFYGYVFKHGQNKRKEITVTAYDQLRYCKAKDTIVVRGDSVTSLVKKMCNYFGLKTGALTNTGYTLATSIQDDKTWLDIIYSGIDDTLTNTGRWYSLRDEFGSIALRDLVDLQLNLVLGDESLVYDYKYDKSIDDEFYNQIKIVSDNESTGKRDVYITKDSGSIAKYGLLQYFEVLNKNANPSQAKSKADMLLKLYNREVETISLDCLGDTSVRAGSSFYGRIGDIELNRRLIVRSVTHKFLPVHTMSLEVAI
ncbi:hypothetical protein CDQ84_12210 [Clostridium thermosuccinogenes]|uniref:YqbQ/XkdQ domain-containing protein n=1 Tax=Clostridium thermosuccinogenes TaxID=84032 RepID=A0A2K2FBU8_9CLOT|nr:hypothetical protein [Pseudoclostridium thermosuccinogenes]AUS95043.1 hypothetical protein CDO33_00390 [Pseudoclostridium thermosuccinogenes]PNT96260.1 hypothetical protein CDQ85_12250 [Pseudoclostridium thermosuccinogenes]PNT97942.1 hypothetical protein CDQ84_12210 [Pseudoclostridium thermosuccinogenes]